LRNRGPLAISATLWNSPAASARDGVAFRRVSSSARHVIGENVFSSDSFLPVSGTMSHRQ
jgi:hypothetical protein